MSDISSLVDTDDEDEEDDAPKSNGEEGDHIGGDERRETNGPDDREDRVGMLVAAVHESRAQTRNLISS